jgi:Ca2+-binding RTX toxin-like protein
MPLFGPASGATIVASNNVRVPVVAERSDGSVVILWVDTTKGSNLYDVRGEIVSSSGTVLVPNFVVSSSAAGDEELPAIAVRQSDGAFLAVWRHFPHAPEGGAPNGIYAQLFDSSGNRVGSEFAINGTLPTGAMRATPLSDGGFMVAWELGTHEIRAQRLDANGAEVGSELSLYPGNSGQLYHLWDMVQLGSGELLVSVEDIPNAIGPPSFSFVQTFDLAGNATGALQSLGAGSDSTKIALTADGGFYAVTATSHGSSLVQRFDSGGDPVGAALSIPIHGVGDIVALSDGGFLLAWDGTSLSDAGQAILAQTFDATGVRSGPVLELSTPGADADLVDITTQGDNSFQLTFFVGSTLETQRFEPQAYPASGTFTGTSANDNLIGGTGDDVIQGLAGNDRLFGWTGNDRLDGGPGVDFTDGGPGDDMHLVDNPGDVVFELPGEGNDTVLANTTYVLGAGVSVETLATDNDAGTASINLTGNELANLVIGNAANNVLHGGSGDDILRGLDGNDLLFGDAGADRMEGGLGNDTYFVDNVGDVIVEAVGQGFENVAASLSYVLTAGAEIEVLSTTDNNGTAAINLVGNEFGQSVIGNNGSNYLNGAGGADVMIGRGGDDTYIVDNPGDVIVEAGGQGFDNVAAGVSYVLTAGAEVEVLSTTDNNGTAAINLVGNEFGQSIIGNNGSNYLNGAGGADVMIGRGGDDTYIVDNPGDVIVEAGGQGFDNVAAGVSYVLTAGAEIEVLSTTDNNGTAAINLVGNEFGQSVIGNAGSNVLDGALGQRR